MTNHAGRDAFAAAAELGHPAMMQVLMSDPRIASHSCKGIAGFIAAASADHAALLQQLLCQTGIDINMRDEHGRTMLMAITSPQDCYASIQACSSGAHVAQEAQRRCDQTLS